MDPLKPKRTTLQARSAIVREGELETPAGRGAREAGSLRG